MDKNLLFPLLTFIGVILVAINGLINAIGGAEQHKTLRIVVLTISCALFITAAVLGLSAFYRNKRKNALLNQKKNELLRSINLSNHFTFIRTSAYLYICTSNQYSSHLFNFRFIFEPSVNFPN